MPQHKQQPAEEKQPKREGEKSGQCSQEFLTITLFEEQATEYYPDGICLDDTMKAHPLPKVELFCPDCQFHLQQSDYQHLPDPLKLLVERLREKVYDEDIS